MILIGQYDSPFVRRVAIALRSYGMAFEHRPWSVFRDAEKIAPFNPLRRVPTLVLDGGEALVETLAILDTLDEMAGRERALIPASGEARRKALQVCALAGGLADKGVALIYEREVHAGRTTDAWVKRCRAQISGVLDVLEAGTEAGKFWHGARPGHADIAVACGLRLVLDGVPGVIDLADWPKLSDLLARCEALPVFRDIYQPFNIPKST